MAGTRSRTKGGSKPKAKKKKAGADEGPASVWQRPATWIVGLVIVAIEELAVGGIRTGISNLFDVVTGKQPVQVVAVPDTLRPDYVLTSPREEISGFPRSQADFDGFAAWARSKGAVDANATAVQVTITGRTSAAVVLTALRVRVLERGQPLEGINVTLPTAGPILVRGFSVDLDASPPMVEPRLEDVEMLGEDATPITFPFRVSSTEPEVFHIEARTTRCDCTWVAELFWTAGGEQGSTIIDDGGEPFRTTSSEASPTYHMWRGRLIEA